MAILNRNIHQVQIGECRGMLADSMEIGTRAQGLAAAPVAATWPHVAVHFTLL
jgi:hypothetical protein